MVLSAWSTVHGLTMLILNSGKVRAETPEQIAALSERVCDTLLSGLKARPWG